MLKEHFNNFQQSAIGKKLTFQFVDAGTNLNAAFIASKLDSTKRNVCISGTLDETFGLKLAQELATINKTYPVRLIGMPTWERINFNRVNDLEVIYTTPFYYTRTNPLEKNLSETYENNVGSKASDFFCAVMKPRFALPFCYSTQRKTSLLTSPAKAIRSSHNSILNRFSRIHPR